MVAAHDLAQWVTFMLARRCGADIGGQHAQVAFTPEERAVVLNLLIENQEAHQKVQNAAASEAVCLTCKELCQLLMALSSPLMNARGTSESLLSNLAVKLIQQVTKLLGASGGNAWSAKGCSEASPISRLRSTLRPRSGVMRASRVS